MAALAYGLCLSGVPGTAQTIPLGEAANVTVLGGSTVSSGGPTIVTGNLALAPGLSVTGFPPGQVVNGSIQINNDLALQAHADADTAYGILVGETSTTDLTGLNLGGMILAPGVYHFGTSADLDGTLTLDAGGDPNAVFHFQIGTTLTTGTASAITLLNGGSLNVFWQVGSSATLGANSVFHGNLLADQSVTLSNGASVFGRVIAIDGAVTMDSNILGPDILVPEPSSTFLLAIGVGLLGAATRRQWRKFSNAE